MREPVERSHESISRVSFGQVVLVPYFDGDAPSVVLQQFNDDFAETARIMSDKEEGELLAAAGTSSMRTIKLSGQESWDKSRVIRGIANCYNTNPNNVEDYARVIAIVEAYTAR